MLYYYHKRVNELWRSVLDDMLILADPVTGHDVDAALV